MSNNILEVNNLRTVFKSRGEEVQAVRGVSFQVGKGEIVGLVGESGSGKSVTMKAILGILPENAEVFGDSIKLNGTNLLELSEEEYRKLRGKEMTMIFQDPMTSLDPTMKIGRQIAEPIMFHTKLYQKEALDNGFTINERCWDT